MSKQDNPQLKLAIILKAHQMSTKGQSNITYDDVLQTVQKQWQGQHRLRFHQMVFDIFDLTLEAVVQHTILHTMKQSLKAPLSDYEVLFGGSQ